MIRRIRKSIGPVALTASVMAAASCARHTAPPTLGMSPTGESVSPLQPQEDITWQTTAEQWRGILSKTFNVYCPPGGATGRTLWGSMVYTDDSSICTAAVHALATFDAARGGTVYLAMVPAQDTYDAESRRGITTQTFASWPGAYRIIGGFPGKKGAEVSDSTPMEITWASNARFLRGAIGSRRLVLCPRNGDTQPVWGGRAEIYTDDSSICASAVHAGLITRAAGGGITVRSEPGRDWYTASTRNGVVAQPWERWEGSFSFPRQVVAELPPAPAEPPSPTPAAREGFFEFIAAAPNPPITIGPAGETVLTWAATATSWRGQPGKLITAFCPPGGSGRPVWGADPYTDDSGVCTAAIHALATFDFARGGTVGIVMTPGLDRYSGDRRHDVTTSIYDSWPASFRVVWGAPGRPAAEVSDSTTLEISWSAPAEFLRGKSGVRQLRCPSEGRPFPVWGSDVYADQSTICGAAVHAGIITQSGGGDVRIRVDAGRSSYAGTSRNGAVSLPLARAEGSFSFVR